MLKCFKNEKLWYAVGGAAAIAFGGDLTVDAASRIASDLGMTQTLIGLTMKLQNDAKATFQNMKDEAQDICCDAKEKAGIDNEVDEEVDA